MKSWQQLWDFDHLLIGFDLADVWSPDAAAAHDEAAVDGGHARAVQAGVQVDLLLGTAQAAVRADDKAEVLRKRLKILFRIIYKI